MSANLPKEKTLSSLYTELCKSIQNEDYDRGYKMCNKILGMVPKESKAFLCKIICMIHLGRFDDCLSALNKNPDIASELYFEKAYCEYRINATEKALKTIESAPAMTSALSELKAQVLYRLGNYSSCYNMYRDIIKNTDDEYDEERQANIAAVVSCLPPSESTTAPFSDIDTYEVLYNKAYKLIAEGEYSQAERILVSCEKLARESLEEDDCNEEEILQEVSFIKVQLGYCLQKQGRIKEAQGIYNNLLKLKLEDEGVVAVCSNNLAAINKDQNLFDSKKKMKAATQEHLSSKLTHNQARVIATNHCLLLYYLNQNENCRKACLKLTEKYPEALPVSIIVRALILHREGNTTDAVVLLRSVVHMNNDQKILLQLTATQLLLQSREYWKASNTLKEMGDATYRPGVVSTLVSLYIAQGDEMAAATTFESTVTWYRQNKDTQKDVSNMWLHAAEFHMKVGNPAVAATCLEELLRANPKNKRVVAQLIRAYIPVNPKKAEELSRQLPSLEELTKDLEDEGIESSNWIYGARTPKANKSEPSPGPKNEEVKKRKKKKKSKTNLAPGVYLDPERWLPKYERSGFKKRRDRRAKDVIKGSQGSALSNSETFDFSGKTAERDIDEDEKTPDKPGFKKTPNQQKKKKKGGRK